MKFLKSKLKKEVYELIDEFQDVFTDENCKVGKTSWETFNIEPHPDSKPVRQRIRPLPPPPQGKLKNPTRRMVRPRNYRTF